MENRNSNAHVSAANPVLAPALMPMADSAKVVVVLVPRIPPENVAMESAIMILFNRGIVPSFFISGVLATAPLTVPTVSKKSVKSREKQIITKSMEKMRFVPESFEELHFH